MEILLRPFDQNIHMDSLMELFRAVQTEAGEPITASSEDMRDQLTRPNHFRWVAYWGNTSEELAGYAVLFHQTPDRCYADIKVRPKWRRNGIGRQLLDRLIQQATTLKTSHLAIDVTATNKDALRFLLSQGFRYRGDTWALLTPAGADFPAPVWPDGYTARSFDEVQDVSRLVEGSNAGFSDLWGHWENTPGLVNEELVADRLKHFDPAGIFIIYDPAGDVAGQCRTTVANRDAAPDRPHILDQPGIAPEHRSKGLYEAMVLMAARWLTRQDQRPIRLESWGDPAGTVAIYESLGFKLIEHEVSYVRELKRDDPAVH